MGRGCIIFVGPYMENRITGVDSGPKMEEWMESALLTAVRIEGDM